MSARLTISSGLGPIEVRAFVAALADAIDAIARARGVVVTHHVVHGDPDTPHSVDLGLAGDGEQLTDLVGTHALLARSERRGKRARKRWYASVELVDTPRPEPVALDLRDVAIEACRASGAGGQHVQKTASAIRVLHIPTGIAVRIEDERSQHQNRSVALARLAEALAERARRSAAAESAARRDACLRVERGSPVRVWRQGREGLVSGGDDAS